jgi:hypothetical protein
MFSFASLRGPPEYWSFGGNIAIGLVCLVSRNPPSPLSSLEL